MFGDREELEEPGDKRGVIVNHDSYCTEDEKYRATKVLLGHSGKSTVFRTGEGVAR